ncbi:MAG TPA: Asp23/Gls24 family envelope stress response protein [Chloroflexota bacterium]|nr:Asp23/Gls24 family envelope stress response protein [Chloroflexota bacterium]
MTQTAQETARTTSAAPSTPTPARNGSTDLTVRSASPNGVGGTTKIDDSVVARIVGLAAREVAGVHDMTSTGLAQAFGGLTNRVTGQDQMDKGVVVQVGDVECIVDLSIVVDYEASIPRVAEAIRRNIASRLGAMTGLETKEVNINVADLYFADNAKGQVAPQHEQPAVR